MFPTLLAFLIFGIVSQQNAPTVPSSNYAPQFDRELASKYCRIRYSQDKEPDARQLADYADRSLTSMADSLGGVDAGLMDGFDCTIRQFGVPQPGLADDVTANSHTEGRGHSIVVSVLAPSSFSQNSRNAVGEPKDADYVFGLVANELSTVLLERVTSDKPKGWYFHSAPPWFVQGMEGYFGLMYSSPHEREVTLPRYLSAARARPDEVSFDHGVVVRNQYLGGVVFVTFLYFAYGERRVNSLLDSPARTFDEAFAKNFGDWGEVENEYRKWIALQPEHITSP
jgi:hypothetical protein